MFEWFIGAVTKGVVYVATTWLPMAVEARRDVPERFVHFRGREFKPVRAGDCSFDSYHLSKMT